jgi:polysaccharide export outer membrane protein
MHVLSLQALVAAVVISAAAAGPAQTPAPAAPAAPANGGMHTEYVIGPGDILGIVFFREKELSGDVAVLPDGRITLPLLNEMMAAGLKPEELRQRIMDGARKFVTDPTLTVVVRQVNSRRVFITGMVAKAGFYPLYQSTTVLQLIATAGGLLEYANKENIIVVRIENGRQSSYKFNYKAVSEQKNLEQNIELKPNDTVGVR